MPNLGHSSRRASAILPGLLATVALAQEPASFLRPDAPFVATEERVPMRDGAHLAADVYLPRAGSGPWPVVLIQTPYDKAPMRPWFQGEGRWGEGSLFTDPAYAFVVTDWRGRAASAAAARPGRAQPGGAEDGYDTVEWVAAQPFSNGRVGTWGPSALGGAQFRTASLRPPHLVCAVPLVMPLNLTHGVYFPGGALWEEFTRTLGRLGWDVYGQLKENPLAGTPFWERLEGNYLRAESIDVPMLVIGGWFDIYVDPVIETFDQLRVEGGPRAREHSRLLIGPWLHRTDNEEVGVLRFPDAPGGGIDRAKSFFDRWLRGIEDPEELARPAVTYFEMNPTIAAGAAKAASASARAAKKDAAVATTAGVAPAAGITWGGAWRTAPGWPPRGTDDRRFYLDPAKDELAVRPPRIQSQDTYRYDPADPLPTPGGHVLTPTLPAGPQDLRAIEARSDVVVFTTPPLRADVTVAGRPRVELWVASDRKDTDITAFLTVVDPEGRSILLGEGVRRLRFRDSTAREALLTPGDAYRIEVDLPNLAVTLPQRHRVRLVLSSSNYPKYAKNLNDGGPLYRDGEGVVATNQIFGGPERRSALVLPALESE